MSARRTARWRSRQFALKLVVLGLLICVMALGVRLTMRQDVFHVSLEPGVGTTDLVELLANWGPCP
ncbi:MAG: hypothetical protein ACYS0D_08655 [Planctomycetota bacterium]